VLSRIRAGEFQGTRCEEAVSAIYLVQLRLFLMMMIVVTLSIVHALVVRFVPKLVNANGRDFVIRALLYLTILGVLHCDIARRRSADCLQHILGDSNYRITKHGKIWHTLGVVPLYMLFSFEQGVETVAVAIQWAYVYVGGVGQ
jgi:hypothetical protein